MPSAGVTMTRQTIMPYFKLLVSSKLRVMGIRIITTMAFMRRTRSRRLSVVKHGVVAEVDVEIAEVVDGTAEICTICV